MTQFSLDDKINQLQQATEELSRRYHVTATELANLKNKPNNEPVYQRTISKLENKLANLTHEHNELTQIHDSTAQKLNELMTQNTEQAQLIERLSEENKVLKQKNRTAIERAELIQEWLQNIDNGTVN